MRLSSTSKLAATHLFMPYLPPEYSLESFRPFCPIIVEGKAHMPQNRQARDGRPPVLRFTVLWSRATSVSISRDKPIWAPYMSSTNIVTSVMSFTKRGSFSCLFRNLRIGCKVSSSLFLSAARSAERWRSGRGRRSGSASRWRPTSPCSRCSRPRGCRSRAHPRRCRPRWRWCSPIVSAASPPRRATRRRLSRSHPRSPSRRKRRRHPHPSRCRLPRRRSPRRALRLFGVRRQRFGRSICARRRDVTRATELALARTAQPYGHRSVAAMIPERVGHSLERHRRSGAVRCTT